MNKSTRLLSLMMLTAAIAGCGGGGGDAGAPPVGGPSPAPAPGPAPGPSPAPTPGVPPQPSMDTTGLSAADLTFSTSTDLTEVAAEFRVFATELRDAYLVADDAMANRQVSLLAPGVGTPFQASFTCPGAGGGNISIVQGLNGTLNYTYNACDTNGYTYNGSAVVTPDGTGLGYTIQLNGVNASGPDGYNNPSLTGSSTCILGNPSNRCTTSQGDFRWGFDITYASQLANGTHQCNCGVGRRWNVVFDDFGATGGLAYIYATNGEALVERTGDKTFLVTRQIGGTLLTDVQVTLP